MGKRSVLTVLISFLLLLEAYTIAGRPSCISDRPNCDGGTSNDSLYRAMEFFLQAGGDTIRIIPTGERFGHGELREPLGIEADARGFVYVADAMTGKIFRFSETGVSMEFETPPFGSSMYPIDLVADGFFIYVLDYAGNRVLRYDYKGAYLDVLISFGQYGSVRPASLTMDPGGRLVTTDIENHNLIVWSPLYDMEFSIGEYGWAEGLFDKPVKAAILPADRIAVVESGNPRVQIFSTAGSYEEVLVPADETGFHSPRSITADRSGNMFVADPEGGRIVVFSPDGAYSTSIDSYGGERISPSAAVVSWKDRLYVTDLHSGSVLIYILLYSS